jgi:hypothetical protein
MSLFGGLHTKMDLPCISEVGRVTTTIPPLLPLLPRRQEPMTTHPGAHGAGSASRHAVDLPLFAGSSAPLSCPPPRHRCSPCSSASTPSAQALARCSSSLRRLPALHLLRRSLATAVLARAGPPHPPRRASSTIPDAPPIPQLRRPSSPGSSAARMPIVRVQDAGARSRFGGSRQPRLHFLLGKPPRTAPRSLPLCRAYTPGTHARKEEE